ncbi:hypothetical protein ASE11_05320 [Hydrogenophaga sp. Root209]|uniref:DUF1223 domain-containing protein n=1 Tax=Hydrogenophaga sp. Root209 TaxID=1736490 RepID=UPI0006FB732F|nr:DUF1223 domain-containing protein [Hydrogenophaga sp. Root209]KRC01058.1 hypothetical protein ASE11_05320 [Hydrogenophaga sp. Root209]
MILTSRALPCITAFVAAVGAAGTAAQTCEVRSGPRPPAVVELYTSEGCSSCPPADRWLSTLKTQDNVLALSFHVNYWNHLGWRDPFATPETTARQYQLKEALRGKHVYTPQVVLNGRDHRDWHGQAASHLSGLPAAAAPALRLSRQGTVVTAQIAATPGTELAGYWAVLQDGLVSKVTRGENAGESLRHDHVVSLYQPVAPWAAGQGGSASLVLPAGSTQRLAFVVTNPGLTQPVQALVLQCPA